MRNPLPKNGGSLALPMGTLAALGRVHLLGTAVPLSMTISLTHHCPGRCTYCGIWDKPRGDEREASWWKQVLRVLWKMGTRRVSFTGGEPLSYGGVQEVVAQAAELGMLVSMGTNGLLLAQHPELLAHLDRLVVSVDGPQVFNDRQRFPGSYEAAVEAIRMARERSVPVWVTAVVTRESVGEIESVLRWALEFGVKVNLQLPFHPPAYSGTDNTERFPTKDQLVRLLETLRTGKWSREVLLNSAPYWQHLERFGHLGTESIATKPAPPGPFRRCVGGRLFGHLEPDGAFYPCTNLIGSFPGHLLRGETEEQLEKALRAALEASKGRTCVTCLSTYAFEQSLLFNLHPGTVLRWVAELLS